MQASFEHHSVRYYCGMVPAQHSFSTALVPDYHTTSGKVLVLAYDRSGGVADIDEELGYWVKLDQLLLGWIRATISREVLRHLVGLQTTFDVRQTLESRLNQLDRANMISSVSHTGLNSINLVQPPTHGHVETSGHNFQFSGPNINVGHGFSPRAWCDRGFVGNYNYRNENYNTRGRGMLNHFSTVFHSQALLLEVLILGLSLLEFHTLYHTLYNLSYGSMSGLSNPFSYGVSKPLGSSNNISGQVPQQFTGFYVHNGVPHFGAPLSASIGMNSVGYPFMPPMSASIGSNVIGHSSVPQITQLKRVLEDGLYKLQALVLRRQRLHANKMFTSSYAADFGSDRDKGHYFSNCATKSAAGVSGVVDESFCFPLTCTTSSQSLPNKALWSAAKFFFFFFSMDERKYCGVLSWSIVKFSSGSIVEYCQVQVFFIKVKGVFNLKGDVLWNGASSA
ncbi:hypothetical protein FEM48_Zijuj11G0082300 [Ziziphus jujuba var. spinosa]|uniref:Uncharacterized protein n=1 Tax=Ziziphus jujuba var. spinosa TaxID=714518 RepID=A0A978UHT8_ZIZJJ|nr:hypothetical protein FEM48_Zijuj11G0082300 [Ziziphus jujuba var. spinosa]